MAADDESPPTEETADTPNDASMYSRMFQWYITALGTGPMTPEERETTLKAKAEELGLDMDTVKSCMADMGEEMRKQLTEDLPEPEDDEAAAQSTEETPASPTPSDEENLPKPDNEAGASDDASTKDSRQFQWYCTALGTGKMTPEERETILKAKAEELGLDMAWAEMQIQLVKPMTEEEMRRPLTEDLPEPEDDEAAAPPTEDEREEQDDPFTTLNERVYEHGENPMELMEEG